MADNNHNAGWFRPWKDGAFENTVKFCGGVFLYLLVSGLFGAGLDPVKSNPYVWGITVRNGFLNITGR